MLGFFLHFYNFLSGSMLTFCVPEWTLGRCQPLVEVNVWFCVSFRCLLHTLWCQLCVRPEWGKAAYWAWDSDSETFLSPVSADSHFSDSQHMALASVTACAGSDKSWIGSRQFEWYLDILVNRSHHNESGPFISMVCYLSFKTDGFIAQWILIIF